MANRINNDVTIFCPSKNKQSRIMDSTFWLGKTKIDEIKKIYFNNITSKENLNYLIDNLDLGVDDVSQINTSIKLKNKMRKAQISDRESAPVLEDMPAMDMIIDELLSKGIIQEQYKLVSNGKAERERNNIGTAYGDAHFLYNGNISLYNARVEDSPLTIQYNLGGQYKDCFALNTTPAVDIMYYYKYSAKIDGITAPIIVNDDNKRNKSAAKRILNKALAKGSKLELSNSDEYDILVTISEETMREVIANIIATYFDGYREYDKDEMARILLWRLFYHSDQIVSADGDEYIVLEYAELTESDFSQPSMKNHRKLIDRIYELQRINYLTDVIRDDTNDNGKLYSFDTLIKDNEERIELAKSKRKEIEDRVLADNLSDKVVSSILEVSENCKEVEIEYINKMIETLSQLQSRYGDANNMLAEISKK